MWAVVGSQPYLIIALRAKWGGGLKVKVREFDVDVCGYICTRIVWSGIGVICEAFVKSWKGFSNWGELFCQEFMPMVMPLCYMCCEKNKNIAMASGLFGTSGLVFKEGVCSNRKDCEKVTGVGVVPS